MFFMPKQSIEQTKDMPQDLNYTPVLYNVPALSIWGRVYSLNNTPLYAFVCNNVLKVYICECSGVLMYNKFHIQTIILTTLYGP